MNENIGEILICLYGNAINNVNYLPSTFYIDTITNYDLSKFTSIEQIHINITIEDKKYILMHEISLIFKLSTNVNDKLFINIVNFYKIACDIIHKKNKPFKLYNKYLNIIQQHIINCEYDIYYKDIKIDNDIINKRNYILSIKPYYENGTRKNTTINITPSIITHINNNSELEYKRINYDGLKTTNLHVILRTKKLIDKNNNYHNLGLTFGCYSKEHMFNMFVNAIENTTPSQLKYVITDDTIYDNIGSIKHNNILFTLELHLQHGSDVYGVIESNNTDIIQVLSRHRLQDKQLDQLVNKFYISSYYYLGYYINYNYLIKKKIKNLIDSYFNDPLFPYITMECYRNSCKHMSIFKKPLNENYIVTCQNCNFADFCLKCCKMGHPGLCELIDTSSEIWINENSKKCPNCNTNIIKNDGCNHMKCTICHTDFCWLCNLSFNINEINEHYTVNNIINPYINICIGLLT